MKRLRNVVTFKLMLKLLISLQLLAGIVLILFTDIARGLSLFGSAALIYIGHEVLEQLSSLRELLTYSLFKQGSPQDATLSHAVHPHEPSRPSVRQSPGTAHDETVFYAAEPAPISQSD